MNKKMIKFVLCLNLVAAGAFISGKEVFAEEVDFQKINVVSSADAEMIEKNIDENELPSSVDLRTRGMVSKIRNQGDLGTCWAHAALGSIENSMIADDPDIDLSEMYLAYMACREFGGDYSEGKNISAPTSLMANWVGPVYEYTAPYGEDYSSELSREEISKEAVLHLTNTHSLPNPVGNYPVPENMAEIKKALNDGHSLNCSISHFDQDMFYNKYTNAYYSAGEYSPVNGHAVILVGYDDNFSRDAFPTDPGMDGAWLIKNSWDTSFGDNGYFWVSYSEALDEVMYFDVEYAQEHDTLYEYDDYGSNAIVSETEEGEETIWGSNIYTASENCYITDVMLFCVNPDDICDISVYTELKNENDPVSGTEGKVTEAVLDGIGYRTVKLSEPVYVREGEKFSVVVKYSGTKGYHVACEYSCSDSFEIPDEEPQHYVRMVNEPINLQAYISEEMIRKTFGRNQSFYSTDGQSWKDMADVDEADVMYAAGNISIKAMAVKESKVWFSDYSSSVKKGTAVELSVPDNKNIYYSINDGDFKLYKEPVTVNEDMSISAYAEGFENDVYFQNYSVRKANISSLLINNMSDGKQYVDFSSDNSCIFYVAPNSEYLEAVPVTTGKIDIDGAAYTSGDVISLEAPERTEDKIYKIKVHEEGLDDTEYTLTLKNTSVNGFSGMFFSDKLDRIYYFDYVEDDEKTGYYVDVKDKKRTDFSYSIFGNRIVLKEDGTEFSGDIASSYNVVMISWDNGETDDLRKIYDETDEIYSYDELTEMFKTHYEYMFNKAPKSVKTEAVDFETVKITAEDEGGIPFEYNINIFSAVGTDKDDKCIDFSASVKDTGIYDLNKGTWISKISSDYYKYYYFAGNGEDYSEFDIYGSGSISGKYHIDNRQIKLTAEDGFVQNGYIVINDDNTASLSFAGTTKYSLERVSEESPENMLMYSIKDIENMITEYEENKFCRKVTAGVYLTGYDTVFADVYMPGDSDFYQSFSISLKDAKGTNQNGEEVDLKEYDKAEESVRFSGVWKFYEKDTYDGFVSFSKDKAELIRKDKYGVETKYSYTACGNNAVLCSEDEKIFVQFRFDGEEVRASVIKDDDEIPLRLEYQTNGDFNSFKFYTIDELGNMAAADYEKEINKTGCIYEYAIECGDITIAAIDTDEKNPQLKVYSHIDPVTGMAYDEHKTESYNLPQTGVSSGLYILQIVGAFLSLVAGAFLALFSGKSLKKKEK